MSLRERLSAWPMGPDGEPEKAVLLRNEADLPPYRDICCSLLESFDIPFYTRRPGAGEVLFLGAGFSGQGIDIYVPASRLEEAMRLLNAAAQPAEEETEEE